MDPFPQQMLLSRADVIRFLGLSLSAWKRFEKSTDGKKFPKPVVLGTKPKWHKLEVFAYVQALPREKGE